MKVSVNWVKKYVDVKGSEDDLVDAIGKQLGEVEGVETFAAKFKGVLIAKVVTCEPHPNADNLSVCKLDDGGVGEGIDRDGAGHVTVVCGAPNVRAGLLVAWIPPGAVVPSTHDQPEPFLLASKELRGIMSYGMIASSKELGLSDNHAGILEVEEVIEGGGTKPANEISHIEALTNYQKEANIRPGMSFAEAAELDDHVIDIENKMFTHRPDCFGILGVAREIAGIQGTQFESPGWYNDQHSGATESPSIDVHVDVPDLVPRFTAQIVRGVEIKESPLWLQSALTKVGVRPINNIVDITNYIMYLTGQPLHAFDLDKLAAKSKGEKPMLQARLSLPGEKLTLLGGKEITLDQEAIVIATDQEPVALGGIMGGADTEVDENTKNIILECANFDMYAMRRASMHYGLFTDALTRFNKGQSPHQNLAALGACVSEIICWAGGVPDQEIVDIQADLEANPTIAVTADFINSRLGSSLSEDEIRTMLGNVEFGVEGEGELQVTAPFWRTDIHIREDLVEEVGRLYGYHNLELELPKRSTKPVQLDSLLSTKSAIRSSLAAAGANEVLTYSFVHSKLIESVGQDTKLSFGILNALSPDLHYYRQTLMPSLLDRVNPNVRAGYDEFAIFEIGKTHTKLHKDDDNGLPKELEMVACVYTNKKGSDDQPAYFSAKAYLDALASDFGMELAYTAFTEDPGYPITKPYDISRSASVTTTDGAFVGIIGEFRPEVESALKLPRHTAGFEIDTTVFVGREHGGSYQQLSEYPNSDQDVTLAVGSNIPYGEVHTVVSEVLKGTDLQHEFSLTSIFEPDAMTINYSFNISLTSLERTLKTDEVSAVIADVVSAAADKLKAKQV